MRAAVEAEKFCQVTRVGSQDGWWQPPAELGQVPDGSAYAYLCSNETVNGIEYFDLPEMPESVPLCVDMSSDFCSKEMDYSKSASRLRALQRTLAYRG